MRKAGVRPDEAGPYEPEDGVFKWHGGSRQLLQTLGQGSDMFKVQDIGHLISAILLPKMSIAVTLSPSAMFTGQ